MADPDERSSSGICRLLREAGYEPVAAASGEQALRAAREGARVAILEVSLPGLCGYEVCRRLREQYADSVAIVFVSATRTESFDRVGGLLLGADDYITKPLAPDEFLARVGRLVRRATGERATRLTRRELEVLRLLERGLRQREIAARLFISEKTVGTHVEHIFSKLGASNRLQAVAIAHRQRLVSPAT